MAKSRKKRLAKNKKLASQLAIIESNQSSKSEKRRAKKYVEMKEKNKQKVEIIPRSISASQLADWKLQLEPLVYEANMRIEMIQSSGYTSFAVDRVIQEGGRDYFDLEDITTREDLIAENTRMRVFLNDQGSTMKGAKLETAQIYSEKYKGKFGSQYKNEANDYAFDTSIIDPEVAKKAFESYRRIEEDRASIIGKQGMPGVFGSENLIIAIYDAEIRGKDSQLYGKELLDAFEAESSFFIKKQHKSANEVNAISGLIEVEMKGGRLF